MRSEAYLCFSGLWLCTCTRS